MGMGSTSLNVVLAASYGALGFVYLVTAEPPFDATGHLIGRDFINPWTASQHLAAGGHLPDLFDHTTYRPLQEALFGRDLPPHGWSYPPHFLLIAASVAGLAYLPALATWSLVTIGAYLLVVPRGQRFALLLAPATFLNLFAGQTGCLVAALLIGGLAMLDRRPILAGVLFGLASIKPHLGMLVPLALVAAGAWRSVGSAALTVVGLVAVSGWLFGWETWHAWITTTAPLQTRILEHGTGLFTWMMPSAFMGARLIGLEAGYAYLVQAPFTLLAAVATWWAFRVHGAVPLAFAVLLFSSCIATPYIFVYDLTLVCPAVLLLLCHGRTDGSRLSRYGEACVWQLVWLLPILTIAGNAFRLPMGWLILTVALGFVVARLRGRARRA